MLRRSILIAKMDVLSWDLTTSKFHRYLATMVDRQHYTWLLLGTVLRRNEKQRVDVRHGGIILAASCWKEINRGTEVKVRFFSQDEIARQSHTLWPTSSRLSGHSQRTIEIKGPIWPVEVVVQQLMKVQTKLKISENSEIHTEVSSIALTYVSDHPFPGKAAKLDISVGSTPRGWGCGFWLGPRIWSLSWVALAQRHSRQ